MEYRALGNTGLTVSAIGFGCWEMGGLHYGGTDDAEVTAAVHRAIDLGVTLYDTAPNYGFGGSEIVLGKALGGRRKDIILVSKTCISWDPVTFTSKFDGRYSTVKRLNEESLQRLGTDYLDLLLIHWPDPETPLEETMRALDELRQEGKARHIGVSNYTSYELKTARQHAPICANQVGFNMFDRRWQREMFPTARELGVGIMAYGPMAHGLLTGTMKRDTVFGEQDWRRHGMLFGQRLFGPNLSQNLEVVDRLIALARRIGTSLPRLALAWVLREPAARSAGDARSPANDGRPPAAARSAGDARSPANDGRPPAAVSVALSGCRKPSEIEENVQALEVRIDDAIMDEIDEVLKGAAGQVDQVPGRHHQPPVPELANA